MHATVDAGDCHFINDVAQVVEVMGRVGHTAEQIDPRSSIYFPYRTSGSWLFSITARNFCFRIDLDNREYWVTAKHLLTGAKHPPIGKIKSKKISLAVLDPTVSEQKWDSYDFSVLDPGEEIDIVVLAPEHPIQRRPIGTLPLTSAGAPVGGECEFLGFPFAASWMATLDNGSH